MLIHFKLWITFNSQLEQAAKFCFLCSQVAVPDAVENFQKYIKSLGKVGKLYDAGQGIQDRLKARVGIRLSLKAGTAATSDQDSQFIGRV